MRRHWWMIWAFTACQSQSKLVVPWPEDAELLAGFLAERHGSDLGDPSPAFRLVQGVVEEGEISSYELEESEGLVLTGLSANDLPPLVQQNLLVERLLSTSTGVELRRKSCDAEPVKVGFPKSLRVWEVTSESVEFTPIEPGPLTEFEFVVHSAYEPCDSVPPRMTPFSPEVQLLPSGTVMAGRERLRNVRNEVDGENGSDFLHLDDVLRVDDDVVLGRSSRAVVWFKRGVPFEDTPRFRYVEQHSAIQGRMTWVDGEVVVTVDSTPPKIVQIRLDANGIESVRTTTLSISRIRNYHVSENGEILISSQDGYAFGRLGSDLEFTASPDGTQVLGIERIDEPESRYVFTTKAGSIFVGHPPNDFVKLPLEETGTSLLFMRSLLTAPDGSVWFTGHGQFDTTVQPDLIRISPDGAVDRRPIEVDGTCGRNEVTNPELPKDYGCGVWWAGRGEQIAWFDGDRRQVMAILSERCSFIQIQGPTCRSKIPAVAFSELKAFDLTDRWLTAVGKEGAIAEVRR